MPRDRQPSEVPPPDPSDEARDADRAMMAEFLRVRAGELGELAARRLLETHPDLHTRYRPMPALKWRPHFIGRVLDLSAAVLASRPEVFGAQLAWSKTAFRARGVPLDDLRRSLDTLHEVLNHESPPDDRGELTKYFQAAWSAIAAGPDEPPSRLSVETPEGVLAARYVATVLEGDRLAACDLVLAAVRAGLPVPAAYVHVLIPAQQELGRLWHLNELSVAEEHFATSTTLMLMSQLVAFAPRRPRDGRVVLAACVQGNAHDIGIRTVADFLEMQGWRAIHLGADVPAEDLADAATSFGAHLAAISVSLPTQFPDAQDTIRLVRTQGPAGLRILVGGAAFASAPDLWRRWGADGWAASASDAVAEADRLVPLA
ncbi:MAG: cobalamin-dependent protein [Phycisphaerales bacterium]|nr:cobalamin-dependent protein [Phycisphaerales bacterium]